MHVSHVAILPAGRTGSPARIQPDERRAATRIFREFAERNGYELEEVPPDPKLHPGHPPGQPLLGAAPPSSDRPALILWAHPNRLSIEVFMTARRKTPESFFLTRDALMERLRVEFGTNRVVLR